MTQSTYHALLMSTFISMAPINAADLNQASGADFRPAEHLCPITQEVMQDPVVASDGFSYERDAILKWIKDHHTSPMTRAVMVNDVHPNQNLRAVISEWKAEALGKRSVLADMSPDEIIEVLLEEFARNEALLSPEYTARDKDIVVFLGNTGAGKSTLINFLAGKELQSVGQGYALVDSSDPRAMPIGTHLFNSETLYPKSIDISDVESIPDVETIPDVENIPGVENTSLRFFDLPGLNDTDGSVRNLVNAAFVRHILLDAKTVRFVYVAGQDQFTADRGQSVQKTIDVLSQLFVTATDPSRPLDSGLFVVSKEDGLLKDITTGTNANMPKQIQLWKAKGHIAPMYHSRLNHQNTPQHREDLLRRIVALAPQKLISINVGGLYPAETRRDIERMYGRMYESAYQKAAADHGKTLTELKSTLALWQRETFWDEFEARHVYHLYPSINVLKDLTIQTYSRVRNKFIQEQDVSRKKNIERMKRLMEDKGITIEQETRRRAETVISRMRAEQGQFGGVPYDFANHSMYWNAVCGPEELSKITKDTTEQEIIRKAYSQWVGEHYQRQIANNPVMLELQRKVEELSRYVADQQRKLERLESSSIAVAAITRPFASRSEVVIPDIAKGHEAVYHQFLRGKLVYKPDPNSDAGRIEFPISALTNPLAGTFDISGCGDSAEHLSISTGFRTVVNPANKSKLEVWIVPRFVIDNDPEAHAYARDLRGIDALTGQPFAVLFNWGGWSNLSGHKVAAAGDDNLFDTLRASWCYYALKTAVGESGYVQSGFDSIRYSLRSITHFSYITSLANMFTFMSE